LVRGPITADFDLAFADVSVNREQGGMLGTEVTFLGDLDGDGANDIALAAPSGDRDRVGMTEGVVYVFVGGLPAPRTGAWSYAGDATAAWGGDSGPGAAGLGLSGGVDYTEDGMPDLAIGAPWADNGGVVYLLGESLLTGGSLVDADARILQMHPGVDPMFGAAVFSAGDVNGDGVPDLAVGWGGYEEDGAASAIAIFNGPVDGQYETGDADALVASSTLGIGLIQGASVAVGDVDGDGIVDLLLGSRDAEAGGLAQVGVAFLLSGSDAVGKTNTTAAMTTFWGIGSGQQLGSAVAAPGDIDGDGAVDLLIGAPGAGGNGHESGGVCLWYGPVATGTHSCITSDASWLGAQPGDLLGYSLLAGHDLTGEDYADIVMGAPGGPGPDLHSGITYVVAGIAP
jgi:hypothetical protein